MSNRNKNTGVRNIDKLNSTFGKFSTIVAELNGATNNFCAKISSATANFVSFFDVNSGRNRRIPTCKIKKFRSGNVGFSI